MLLVVACPKSRRHFSYFNKGFFLKKNVIMLLSNGEVKTDARVVTEATSLSKNGYNVLVLAWDRQGTLESKDDTDGFSVERIRLRLPFLNLQNLALKLAIFNFSTFLTLLGKDFDVLHCHDFDTLVGGLLAGKIRGKKIVYDAHEIYSLMAQTKISATLAKALASIESLSARQVDLLITVNEVCARYFRENCGSKVKVPVIMNCRDPSSLSAIDSFKSVKTALGIDDYFVVLYNGWLIPNSGVEELVAAIGLLKEQGTMNIAAIICGNGSSETEFKEMVREKNLESNIKFVGRIESKKIPALASASDVLFIVYDCRDMYSFFRTPARLFDAMIAGKPVIGSNFGQIKKIVEKSEMGVLVNPGKIDELCRAILLLYRDKNLRLEMGRKAKDLSRTYNWRLIEKKFLRLYEDLYAHKDDLKQPPLASCS